jgi:hypothetical protein
MKVTTLKKNTFENSCRYGLTRPSFFQLGDYSSRGVGGQLFHDEIKRLDSARHITSNHFVGLVGLGDLLSEDSGLLPTSGSQSSLCVAFGLGPIVPVSNLWLSDKSVKQGKQPLLRFWHWPCK